MKQQQPEYAYKKKEPEKSLILEGKLQPQANDIEKAVLGAIMLRRGAFDEVSEVLSPECFYVQAHELIFRSMKKLALKNQPIDLLTVVEQLKSDGKLEEVGGPFAITQLQAGVVSAANLLAHSRIVYEKYHLRQLIKISSEILIKAYESGIDNFDLQDHAEKAFNDLGMKQSGGMLSMENVMKQVIDKVEGWRQKKDSITGVPSSFPEIDKATRGWQPGDLIILAARPSVGKTAFALNLIRNAASNEKNPVMVGVWSLEMKAVYLGLRMLAAESKTILYKLQTGKLNDDEMYNLSKIALEKLALLNIHFEENTNITLASLSRKARRLKKKEGLGLIVIDYLQLMSGDDKKGNREQEISTISRGLKNLAQELEIPIIALSQLSREMGAKNVSWQYGPPISAIRESGAIEQDADVIIMLWGPSDEDISKDPSLIGRRKAKIGKQRNGVLITEELNLKADIQLFEALENIYEPNNNHVGGSYRKIQPVDEDDEDPPF